MRTFTAHTNPFGNPDGAKSDLLEIREGFVKFADKYQWGGVALTDSSRRTRIIVGKKGSGKTVYMRLLEDEMSQEKSVLTVRPEQDIRGTSDVSRFCDIFRDDAKEKWSEVWQCALLYSLRSLLLFDTAFRHHVGDRETEPLRQKKYERLGPAQWNNTTIPVYGCFVNILRQHNNSRNVMEAYLHNPAWTGLKSDIGHALHTSPPVYLYLDSLDLVYENAPKQWLQCQRGLVDLIIRLLHDDQYNDKFHVCIALRDTVYSAFLSTTEQQLNIIGAEHIQVLDWSATALRYFLRRKVEALDARYFVDPTAGRSVAGWLGTSSVTNDTRLGVTEDIESYIIRHTRYVPRDIVHFGNEMCRDILRIRQEGRKLEPSDITRRLSRCAYRTCGNALDICAGQLASLQMPSSAANDGYDSFYTGSERYRKGIADDLIRVIKQIDRERFSTDERAEASRFARDVFGIDYDVFSLFWQNGLVGYFDSHGMTATNPVFFNNDSITQFELPIADQYIFHPCVIDRASISFEPTDPPAALFKGAD